VHPLIQVGLLGVDVTVKVDDPQIPTAQVLGNTSHGRESYRVVTPQYDGKGARLIYMPHPLRYLVKTFFYISGDGEYVP
jgi:hypothetical protein